MSSTRSWLATSRIASLTISTAYGITPNVTAARTGSVTSTCDGRRTGNGRNTAPAPA